LTTFPRVLVEKIYLWQNVPMSLFCFLWTPLLYLFWRSIAPLPGASNMRFASSGEIWALLLGSAAAFVRFLSGPFISPGAFGLSRWASACVDVIALPAALPLLVCALLVRLRAPGVAANYAIFALLWLVPGSVMATANRSAPNDPSLLALTAVLRTAVAAGIPWFAVMTGKPRSRLFVPRALAATVFPFLAATVYWAFFSQRTWLGILLLVPALAPMAISAAVNFRRTTKARPCANQ
jgi:hypothetical protein